MTEPDPLRPAGSLTVAAVLAATAGYTDAHIFLHVAQVFVANMSGNVVLAGMAAGQRDVAGVAGPLVAMAGFVAGMAAGTAIHNATRRRGLPARPDRLLLAEVGTYLVLIATVATFPVAASAGPATLRAVPVLLVGGIAMGLQTPVLRRVGDVPVVTTYESAGIASLGEESILANDPTRDPAERRHRRRVVLVLCVVVGSYAVGAAVAAALGSSPVLLLGPVAVLAAIAVALRPRARSAPQVEQ